MKFSKMKLKLWFALHCNLKKVKQLEGYRLFFLQKPTKTVVL